MKDQVKGFIDALNEALHLTATNKIKIDKVGEEKTATTIMRKFMVDIDGGGFIHFAIVLPLQEEDEIDEHPDDEKRCKGHPIEPWKDDYEEHA